MCTCPTLCNPIDGSPPGPAVPGVLQASDSDRSFAAEFEQESQASSCVEEWNSACLSSCSRVDRSLLELCVVPAGFSGRGRLWQFAQPRPLSLLQRGLAPRSKGKARAELRPARRQSRGGHSFLWCAGFSVQWLLLLQSTGSRHSGFSSYPLSPSLWT